jgi:hypothetical protein
MVPVNAKAPAEDRVRFDSPFMAFEPVTVTNWSFVLPESETPPPLAASRPIVPAELSYVRT